MSANQFFTLIISLCVLNNEKCYDTAMNDSNNVILRTISTVIATTLNTSLRKHYYL